MVHLVHLVLRALVVLSILMVLKAQAVLLVLMAPLVHTVQAVLSHLSTHLVPATLAAQASLTPLRRPLEVSDSMTSMISVVVFSKKFGSSKKIGFNTGYGEKS